MSNQAFFRSPQPAGPKRKRGADYIYLLMGAVLLVGFMLFVISKRSNIVNTGYRIGELRDQNAQMREDQAKLRERLNRLTRPNEIFEKALALGLRPVSSERRIEVVINNAPHDEAPPMLLAGLEEE